jgi:hypothetical protein
MVTPGLVAVQEPIRSRKRRRMTEMVLRMHGAKRMDLEGEGIGECLVRALERFKEMGMNLFLLEGRDGGGFLYMHEETGERGGR